MYPFIPFKSYIIFIGEFFIVLLSKSISFGFFNVFIIIIFVLLALYF